MALELHPDAANAIGMITGYWSQVEFYLCLILERILKINRAQSLALWYSSANHRARIDMIKAVADVTLPGPLKGEFAELVNRINECARHRNNIQHDLWSIISKK